MLSNDLKKTSLSVEELGTVLPELEKVHTIAIIGRPNVGKSTLFNMLVRKRLAITHEQAGVTRDIKQAQVEYDDVLFEFLDTGGITDEGVHSDKIKKLSLSVLPIADVIIFLVASGEITAEDEFLVDMFRKVTKPVLLVVNKVDNESREWESAEFFKFGLGAPIMVSALHKINLDFLWEEIFSALGIVEALAEDANATDDLAIPDATRGKSKRKQARENLDLLEDEQDFDGFDKLDNTGEGENLETLKELEDEIIVPNAIRLLIMGKPNTGKSSLLNAFLQKERVMVSEIAGTTRDIIEEDTELYGQKFTLIDSAGIRRKNKIYDDVEYYSSHRAISAIDESDIVVLLIDVIEGMAEQDKKLASLIIRKGKGIVIGLNKWDLIEIKENRLNAEKDRLSYLVPQLRYAPVCAMSAKDKKGLKNVVEEVKKLHVQLYFKVNTSLLNRDAHRWVDKNPPPSMSGKRGKLKFIAQASVNPIIFKARVNNPRFFSESYKQYLINNIRSQYNLKNVPIMLDFILN